MRLVVHWQLARKANELTWRRGCSSKQIVVAVVAVAALGFAAVVTVLVAVATAIPAAAVVAAVGSGRPSNDRLNPVAAAAGGRVDHGAEPRMMADRFLLGSSDHWPRGPPLL